MRRLADASVIIIPDTNTHEGGKLKGKSFVLTGTLASMSRAQAKEKIRALGGTTSESVSKKTSFVVAGEEAGTKRAVAEKLGIPVLTEVELLRLIG